MKLNLSSLEGLFPPSSNSGVRTLNLEIMAQLVSQNEFNANLEKMNSTQYIAIRLIEEAIKGRIVNARG